MPEKRKLTAQAGRRLEFLLASLQSKFYTLQLFPCSRTPLFFVAACFVFTLCRMTRPVRTILLLLAGVVLFSRLSYSQQAAINFHHLTVRNGLNDGIINAIVQDKYGYMWFASYGAINRFNGTQVYKYEHRLGDRSSAPGGIVHALFCHSSGRLFIGGDDGLLEFDYGTGTFRDIVAFAGRRITAITESSDGSLLAVANNQLFEYSLSTGKAGICNEQQQPGFFAKQPVFSLYRKANLVYAGTSGGYIVYDMQSRLARRKEIQLLEGAHANAIVTDATGGIWVTNVFLFKLIRVDTATGSELAIDKLPAIAAREVQQSYLGLAADAENVWITTSLTGLIQYSVRDQSVKFHQKNVLKPGNIAENILRAIYLSGDGTIWISMLGGVDYFHPHKNVFDVLFPFPALDANQLARGFAEDEQGQYWFTTGDGVTRYNPATGQYRTWRNETGKAPVIYYNSSRAVLADGKQVWIATGKGINRFDLRSGTMQFMTARDSLPEQFYLNINKDSKGQVWFCSNMGDGLYYYTPADLRIHSIRNHPVLQRYTGFGVRRVFEDAQQRLWIGFSGKGYAMYDPANGQTRYWYHAAGTDSSFNSNLVIDIVQDKKGIVWLTTFNGVRGVDSTLHHQYWLTIADGLPSNVTNGILADNDNRLWIGSSAGLTLLDSNRKSVLHFDESYGLPSLEFPEHQAHTTSDGYFVFASNKGYIRFRPSAVSLEPEKVPFFIAGITIPGRKDSSLVDLKSLDRLRLEYNENFFTISLECLNYANPEQTWFAYKLDGLEEDWHYTQDPKAVYTSVPGGTYTFRYKAGMGNGNWEMAEKTMVIRVEKIFYKKKWFWLLIGLVTATILYLLYRYRLQQQQKVFVLEGKTQLLEKEKARVMYESLKQQLNPHFLFNSLTSLSGLIESDQQLAGNFLKQMSKIYRYILKSRDSETVSLKEEIDFVQTYISLQQTRFRKGLDVNISVPPDALDRKIPPVTLQNLIENAIKHNIIDAESPLVITIRVSGEYLRIENNLQKKQMVETSNKQGLASLSSLYSYLSPKPVLIEETSESFCVQLPLI